jgi:quinol monooxygenase YgiN
MYGTVAYLKVKPGKEDDLIAQSKQYTPELMPAGFLRQTIYRLDNQPNMYIMAVVFKDKESYVANANSPEQNARYEKFRALLDDDPRWADGEVIASIQ